MRRLAVLVSFLVRELFRSLTGALIVVAALAFYLVVIASVAGGVDRDYYALTLGGFFGLLSLLITLIIADRVYRSWCYLLLYRLPNRLGLLVAVILTAVLVSGLLEILVALLSLPRLEGGLNAAMVLDIVPVWIAWLALGATVGIHMSEMARRGWSRTVVYAALAFVLFSLNQRQSGVAVGLADRFSWIPNIVPDPSRWQGASKVVDVILWPVAASIRVARASPYTLLESMSPALIVVMAMALLGLAALMFENKDLILPEG